MPLRRPGRIQRAANREVLPFVIEQSNLLPIEEGSAVLVEGEGIVGPAIPQILHDIDELARPFVAIIVLDMPVAAERSEEHTSELQSLMRISYAVFCLKKKTYNLLQIYSTHTYLCLQ